MTVKAILSGKGNAVITIEPTVPLGDAIKILDEHGIGAAVITDANQHVLGILSERDIPRTLARNVRAGGACRLCDESVYGVCSLSGFSGWNFRPEVTVFIPWRRACRILRSAARRSDYGGRVDVRCGRPALALSAAG